MTERPDPINVPREIIVDGVRCLIANGAKRGDVLVIYEPLTVDFLSGARVTEARYFVGVVTGVNRIGLATRISTGDSKRDVVGCKSWHVAAERLDMVAFRAWLAERRGEPFLSLKMVREAVLEFALPPQ